MLFHVPGEHDNLIENRKKTEIIAQLIKLNSELVVSFSDKLIIALKKNKKRDISFVLNPSAPESGVLKSKKVTVPNGVGKDTMPNIPEPADHKIVTKPVAVSNARPNPGRSDMTSSSRPEPLVQLPLPGIKAPVPHFSNNNDAEEPDYSNDNAQPVFPPKMPIPIGALKKSALVPPVPKKRAASVAPMPPKKTAPLGPPKGRPLPKKGQGTGPVKMPIKQGMGKFPPKGPKAKLPPIPQQ